MNLKYRTILLICLAFIFASCAGKKDGGMDEPSFSSNSNLDVAQLAGKRPVTLRELVSYSASQQYSSLDSIYNRPPEGMTGNFYIKLSESAEVVHLADKVSTFVQKSDVLAAGFKNGLVKIYGGGGCGAVQAAASPVNKISWFPHSDYLALTSGENKFVEVFKVNECARTQVANLNSTVDLFSVSPKGSWLAIADEARRLWVGPVDGKLTQIHRFLHKPLSLSFSDGEGILMAVDVTGQLNMWSPLKKGRLFDYKLKGGPFKSVVASGAYLNVITEKGESFRWDVSKKTKTALHEQASGFLLKDGVIYYRSPRKILSRNVYFQPILLSVERSSSGRIFRVNDIDGEFRYYSSVTGEELSGIQDLADWEKVKLDKDFKFSHRGHEFVLAEPIAQREFQRLYCRFLPNKGYYLWWEKASRPDDYFISRGLLPRRKGISAQAPMKWEPFEAGKIDIRD